MQTASFTYKANMNAIANIIDWKGYEFGVKFKGSIRTS
jgi:hypothetical protein